MRIQLYGVAFKASQKARSREAQYHYEMMNLTVVMQLGDFSRLRCTDKMDPKKTLRIFQHPLVKECKP